LRGTCCWGKTAQGRGARRATNAWKENSLSEREGVEAGKKGDGKRDSTKKRDTLALRGGPNVKAHHGKKKKLHRDAAKEKTQERTCREKERRELLSSQSIWWACRRVTGDVRLKKTARPRILLRGLGYKLWPVKGESRLGTWEQTLARIATNENSSPRASKNDISICQLGVNQDALSRGGLKKLPGADS